jgi:hypothetical protein
MKDSNFRPQRRTSILVVLALTFLLLLLPSTIVQQVAAVFENVCLQQDRTTEKGECGAKMIF